MAEGVVLTRHATERGVHEMAQRAGGGAGAAVVRQYVGYEEWPAAAFARREVARHGLALILGFGEPIDVFDPEDADGGATPSSLGAFVVGNQLGSSMTGVGGHQLGVQIELTPVGALALFGDVERFNDAVIPLDEALGERGPRLVERLAETPSWADRFELLDATFAYTDELPELAPEVTWLRRRLQACCGRAPVEPLMDETGWSRRHVTERFRRQLGVSPKSYARLLRFEHATALLTEPVAGRSIADVAMEAGYYDQSHMTRDFASLARMTPGEVLAHAASAPEVRFVQDAAGGPPA
jgi:AraC-like DNA-binding protein